MESIDIGIGTISLRELIEKIRITPIYRNAIINNTVIIRTNEEP